jgi:pSer/pThr/pTyr-binding forkhead associated (FHA) protein
MNKKLADLLAKAHRLESTIAATIEGAARRTSAHAFREPLEIVHAIVEHAGREVQPAGRGRQVFPFNHVRVVALAPTARDRARLQVAFDGPPSLQERIASHLDAAGCVAPALTVHATFANKAGADWLAPEFTVAYSRVAQSTVHDPAVPRLELTVTQGVARQPTCTFEANGSQTIAIGRDDEVRDSRHHLIRTNDLVFEEGGGDINETVSRRHAHIEQDAAGAFRLFDDGSAQGTTVIRKGRGIAVPRGARGTRLQSGDEIVLGRARVRVAITSET